MCYMFHSLDVILITRCTAFLVSSINWGQTLAGRHSKRMREGDSTQTEPSSILCGLD